MPNPLTRADLPIDTVALARFLLGKIVVRNLLEGVVAGRIVETEAYPPGDRAMHAYHRMTDRNRSLFLPPGHAYVYLCYGISQMLNVSSEIAGVGAGVLIRAVEPIVGIELMMERRRSTRVLDLARGPGRLAQAMGIDRGLDGMDLCAGGVLHLAEDGAARGEIGESMRIGITKDANRVLRYFFAGSRYVSGPRALNEQQGSR